MFVRNAARFSRCLLLFVLIDLIFRPVVGSCSSHGIDAIRKCDSVGLRRRDIAPVQCTRGWQPFKNSTGIQRRHLDQSSSDNRLRAGSFAIEGSWTKTGDLQADLASFGL